MSTDTIAVRPPEIPMGERAGVYRRALALIALITLAAFTALLFTGATADAQGGSTLVGNAGRSTSSTSPCQLGSDCAQGFTTGANPTGYRLTSIGLDMKFTGAVSAGLRFRVSLRSSESLESSEDNLPGDHLARFNGRFAITGLNTFDYAGGPVGYQLEPNTEYFVVMDVQAPTGTTNVQWERTTVRSEDPGGSQGWSINDSHWRRGQDKGDISEWTTTTGSLQMRLTGYELPDPNRYDTTPIEDDPVVKVAPGTYTAAQLAPLCREGFHYVYDPVNVYDAGRGRLQYTKSNDVPEGATKVGLEWRDMCFSDQLFDIPIRCDGERCVTRKGHSVYQLHHLDRVVCPSGGLPEATCDALPAARYAAMGRHPEVIAQRRAAAQAEAQGAAESVRLRKVYEEQVRALEEAAIADGSYQIGGDPISELCPETYQTYDPDYGPDSDRSAPACNPHGW